MSQKVYQLVRTLMEQGASKHESGISQLVGNLVRALDAEPPPGSTEPLPFIDLSACRAVIEGTVLNLVESDEPIQIKVSAITAISATNLAGRTPRQ